MYNNRDNNILIKTYPLWIKDFNFSEKISSVVFEEIVEKENSFFIQIKINENALYKIELASFYEKKNFSCRSSENQLKFNSHKASGFSKIIYAWRSSLSE